VKNIFKLLGNIKPIHYLRFLLYAVIIGALYHPSLKNLIFVDWQLEDYSHCSLIPFVVLYFLWEKRQELLTLPSIPSWKGFIPLGFGIILFWLGELGGEFFTQYMSLWLAIVGLCCLHLGLRKVKAIWFSMFIMLAMFPFPHFANVRISLALKLISSQFGVWLLHLYGMSAYREGNVIDLGFTQLQVVDACSGLRYLIPLMVLSLILAYWFKARFWKRAILFLSSIPITIVVNSFRIAATGVLYQFFGPAVAEGFFHDFSGWLIFMISLGILLGEMWILKKIGKDVEGMLDSNAGGRKDDVELHPHPGAPLEGEEAIRAGSVAGEGKTTLSPTSQKEKMNWKGFFRPPQFVVALIILVLTLLLSQGVEFREKIPIKQPLGQFPLQVGEWIGTTESMEQKFIDTLHFSDYVIVNYKDKQGQSVNFYVAYYESQRSGESSHSPETCLPAGGWSFNEAGTVTLSLSGSSPIRINRAFVENTGAKQLTYYWFAQRGRVLTSLFQVKIYSFWDALTRQRTDGALVRLMTPVYPQEKIGDAERRLQAFTQQIVPVLDGYIPK